MKQAKNKKLGITIAAVYVIILLGLYAYLYLFPQLSEAMAETYIVQYGQIDVSYKAECIVVRNEQVYTSDYTGSASFYIEEGEKTRIGTRVADIYSGGEKHGLYCGSTGFVSYYYDGCEAYLTPDSVKQMNPSEYMNIKAEAMMSASDSVEPGSFVFKLVDGDTWYIMLPLTEDQLPLFRIGNKISLVLDDGTVLVANAERVVGDESLAIMARVLSYYPDFCKIRCLNVKIITTQTKGLEIPVTAISYTDDNPGVMVLGTDGLYHFTRVEILNKTDEIAVVAEDQFETKLSDGTVKIISSVSLYDEILRNAE